jgi:hypothetical protein
MTHGEAGPGAESRSSHWSAAARRRIQLLNGHPQLSEGQVRGYMFKLLEAFVLSQQSSNSRPSASGGLSLILKEPLVVTLPTVSEPHPTDSSVALLVRLLPRTNFG